MIERVRLWGQGVRARVGVHIHPLRAGTAKMAAPLGGIEALTLTGVGENATVARALAVEALGFLGWSVSV